MTFLYLICFLLLAVGIILLLGLTPDRVMKDLSRGETKGPTLRSRTLRAKGKQTSHRLTVGLCRVRDALETTGKSGRFALACALSLLFMLVGTVLAIAIDNLFLIPVLALAMALIPFAFLRRTITYYRNHITESLETALSSITASYIRTDDIVTAVEENIGYLRPPLRDIFAGFLADCTMIRANRKECIRSLQEKIDNTVFADWCDTLIACEDDRSLKHTLMPIVTKLTDIAIVNRDIKAMMTAARTEYFVMAGMVLANIPLLYLLNKDWYAALMDTIPGKIVLAICGAAILITGIFAFKFTKPVEYRKGGDR